jgi:hypothetical protein
MVKSLNQDIRTTWGWISSSGFLLNPQARGVPNLTSRELSVALRGLPELVLRELLQLGHVKAETCRAGAA